MPYRSPTIPCSTRVHTPYIDQGARANLTIEVDPVELATLHLTIPVSGLEVMIVLSGEHLEQLATELAKARRATRKAAMKADTARAEVAS
jgi:hypothetical protein